MGDRCYLQICVHKDDKEKAIEVTFNALNDRGDPGHGESCWLVEEQSAPADTTGELCAAGIRYYGSHGPGCQYGSYTFVCDGKEVIECPCGFEIEEPMVAVEPSGKVAIKELEHARAYWRMMAETLALFDPKTAAEGKR